MCIALAGELLVDVVSRLKNCNQPYPTTAREIDVEKEYQGQGIVKALLNKTERLARNKGMTALVTVTSINSEGKPWKTYGFWIRMGYKDTGERKDSGHGPKYCKLVKRL